MPRPRKTIDESESVLPAAARKRAPRKKVTSEGDGVTPSPRRRVSRTAVTSPVDVPVSANRMVTRKAPTPVAATMREGSRRRTQAVVTFAFSLVLAGAGVAIGMSDKGTIDVVASITEQNERINRGEVRDESGGVVTGTVPVQNVGNVPNGGFVPVENTEAAPTPVTETTPEATQDQAAPTSTAPTAESDVSTDEGTASTTKEEQVTAL
jgi:hypothetical protein